MKINFRTMLLLSKKRQIILLLVYSCSFHIYLILNSNCFSDLLQIQFSKVCWYSCKGVVCDGKGNKQSRVKRTGTTFNQLCYQMWMPSLNLILGYVNKNVNVLLSSIELTGLGSQLKTKEGINFSRTLCEVFLVFPAFPQEFKMVLACFIHLSLMY